MMVMIWVDCAIKMGMDCCPADRVSQKFIWMLSLMVDVAVVLLMSITVDDWL